VTRDQLANIKPDTEKMWMMEKTGMVKGVILTVLDLTENYHFLSRYFAPWNGIPEDPVTGSAHTVLAPYWSTETGLRTMSARQCSPRGGNLHLYLLDNGRLEVGGQAVVVMEGIINV